MSVQGGARARTLVGAILASRPAAAVMAVAPVPLVVVRRAMLADNAAENRRDAWTRLRSETDRYAAVRAATERYAAEGFVLDVGCSQGILREGLHCRRYEGIDSFAPAIELARARTAGDPDLAGSETTFRVADAEAYVPAEAPDAVVLNEVVYYLRRPVAVVEHYARRLAPEGVVVLSIYARSWSSRRLLRVLDRRLQRIGNTLVSDGHLAWTVAVYRPRPAEG